MSRHQKKGPRLSLRKGCLRKGIPGNIVVCPCWCCHQQVAMHPNFESFFTVLNIVVDNTNNGAKVLKKPHLHCGLTLKYNENHCEYINTINSY